MSWYDWLQEDDASDVSLYWIDAGLAALEPRGEVILTDEELYSLSFEELRVLDTLVLYSNQWVLKEEDILTRDTRIAWKYHTPCITTLKEQS